MKKEKSSIAQCKLYDCFFCVLFVFSLGYQDQSYTTLLQLLAKPAENNQIYSPWFLRNKSIAIATGTWFPRWQIIRLCTTIKRWDSLFKKPSSMSWENVLPIKPKWLLDGITPEYDYRVECDRFQIRCQRLTIHPRDRGYHRQENKNIEVEAK